MAKATLRVRWRARRILRGFWGHLRGTVVAGLILVTPLVVTYLVLRLIFNFLKGLVNPLTGLPFFAFLPENAVIPVALTLTAIILYLAGVVTKYALSGRFVSMAHRLVEAIPGVGAIYRLARQATEVLTGPNQGRKYRRVVIVDFPRKGLKTIGLVTGQSTGQEGEPLLMLYIPTAPNPTSGFTALVPESEVTPTDMSVEDAMKLVISGGVVFPDSLGKEAFKEHVASEEGTVDGDPRP